MKNFKTPSKKTIIVIVSVFLGFTGLHFFLLGKWKAGMWRFLLFLLWPLHIIWSFPICFGAALFEARFISGLNASEFQEFCETDNIKIWSQPKVEKRSRYSEIKPWYKKEL